MVSQKSNISDELFQKFSSLIYDKTGIYMKLEKRELLVARLGKRLRELGIASFQEYYKYLVSREGKEEFSNFIDRISTNFTSFFREKAHFDYLANTVLPDYLVKKASLTKHIFLWSAACSTGEEPYSLAMIIEDFFEGKQKIDYKIYATDISSRVIAQAQSGVYPSERISQIPYPLLKKYFQKGLGNSSGYFKVKKNLQSRVDFKQFNLMHQFTFPHKIDIIFCRNVMIYFNKKTQQDLISKFYDALEPKGYLFIGHSESLSSIDHKFIQTETTTYRKE